MIHRSYTGVLFCVALTAGSFVTGASKALAETTYPFEATYDTLTLPTLLEQTNQTLLVRFDTTAQNGNAPYGLTNFAGSNYGRVNSINRVADIVNSDPAALGLTGQPFGTQYFFGEGEDKLFGSFEGNASAEGTVGIVTITGGEGRFSGATGSLNLTQYIKSSPSPTEPILALTTVEGSFQAVPEPGSVLGTLAFGIGGAGLLLKRRMSNLDCASFKVLP